MPHIAGLTLRKQKSRPIGRDPVDRIFEDRLEFDFRLPSLILGLAGAQKGVDRRDEDGGLDRVRQIPVGPCVEPLDLVRVVDKCG